MKYALIIITFLLSFSQIAKADNIVSAKELAEIAYQECYKKNFNENYNLYDDSLKISLSKINTCLKEKLISEIQQIFTESQQRKVLVDINEIEKGTLNFYWDLYNQNKFTSDGGTIGHTQNEDALREVFIQILKDVIYVRLEG